MTIDDIINNQVDKTGKERFLLKSYLYTALNRLKKRGCLISIKYSRNGPLLWGLPGWINEQGYSLLSHEPKYLPLSNARSQFGIVSSLKKNTFYRDNSD